MINRNFEAKSANEISAYTGIPFGLYTAESVYGVYGAYLLEDLGRIIGYYKVYDDGIQLIQADGDSKGDYIPADLPFTRAAQLINKQARFMFGRPVEFTINPIEEHAKNESKLKEISNIQDLLDSVLGKNKFAEKCIKAFKDCSIGERVAAVVDFDPEYGVLIRFLPSYGFVFETDEYDRLSKLISFYTIHDAHEAKNQRIFRKKWELENGKCKIETAVYDGTGKEVTEDDILDIEKLTKSIPTVFDFIPAVVIVNDGLTGDENGVSEIKLLQDYELWYTKLANADIDAEQQNMNPIRYVMDIDPSTTGRDKLAIKAGAFWDLQTDPNQAGDDYFQGKVGVIESSMNYNEPLGNTLERIENQMYDSLDVPNVSAEKMKGVITSGKSLKAIYWPLQVRCDEKMLTWEPALRFIAETIIAGCKLIPGVSNHYVSEGITDIEYELTIENPYSLPEDEEIEKQTDLAEVSAGTMSRKTYIRKWQRMTETEAADEIEQILKEKTMFDSGYSAQLYNAARVNTEQKAPNSANQKNKLIPKDSNKSVNQTLEDVKNTLRNSVNEE